MIEKEELKDPLLYIPRYLKVLSKVEASRESRLVPMELWPSQKHYIQNRTHRDVCLKSRQPGFSTGVLAANSHSLFITGGERQIIVTHDQETSEFLFQTVQRFHRNLPDELRPDVDWKSGTRMRFPKLDSYIYVDSARSDSLGIGHSLSKCHLSEVAKWPANKAKQLFVDITQTVPMGGYITVESTPKGRVSVFYEIYDAAKRGDTPYKAFFYPWWWDVTCKADPDVWLNEEKGIVVAERINESVVSLKKFEAILQQEHQLSPEQIAFRRFKIAEIRELFFQEYPENDIDCWLSSDISVVDALVLRLYYSMVKDGRQEGSLTVWKDVIGGRDYKIGVDVAAGYAKGDYSVASVIDTRNMEYVARLRGRIPPDLFAEQLYRLGERYNMSEIGVERANHGHTVLKVLLDKDYPNIYYHVDYDEMQRRITNEPGWKTSTKTKPMMIIDLLAAMRASDLLSYSENLLLEASGLVWEGQQKVKTAAGGFDDEWDAVSIALQLREMNPVSEPNRPSVVRYATI